MKKLLLGDEAIAQGAIDAGLSGVYAYPGTPSTEITEYIQNSKTAKERNIHRRWSLNEKTAMEEALGMSFMGKRALVCMKHVGLNVCADPFVNSAMTGVNGGVVVLVADDPSMHSSQNEQDSRFYAKFAMIPCFEPSSQQEAYDMVRYAFDYSEKIHLPILMRVTTRMAHSRAVVEICDNSREQNNINYDSKAADWILLPAMARRKNDIVTSMQPELENDAKNSKYNQYIDGSDKSLGIIASGIAINYLNECYPQGCPNPVIKISQYPLPKDLIRQMTSACDSVLVIEEGQPFIEDMLRGIMPGDATIKGRLTGELPRTGELNPDLVKKALGLPVDECYAPSENVTPRPPALCQGCGHRDVYSALNEVLKDYENARVFGDIGCYTLGAVAPLNVIDTTVCMGASISTLHGMEMAHGKDYIKNWVAVIGDSTFMHTGVNSLINMVYNQGTGTVIIMDNPTTGMTGHQDHAATGKTLQGDVVPAISIYNLCKSIGVKNVTEVNAFDLAAMEKTIKEEVAKDEVSVIIACAPCALLKGVKFPNKCVPLSDKCKKCGMCLKPGCPALTKNEDGTIAIDETMCNGCGLCKQLCKFDAIDCVAR